MTNERDGAGRASLAGRLCLITGANTGIGKATAVELARRGAELLIGCRNVKKGEEAARDIQAKTNNSSVSVLPLDLGSLASVRAAAKSVLERDQPLPLLINNAGVAGQRGITKDGFELHFGTNHLGHMLLTELLLDRIGQSGPSRIVTVSSKSHYDAKGIDFEAVRRPTKTLAGIREYEVSKLCNILFSAELARRLDGTSVTTYVLHPGVVASDAWRRIPWPIRPFVTRNLLSNEDGAKTTLYCATSPEVAKETGCYYDECRKKEPSSLARDETLARELWKRSEEWIAG